MSVQELENLIRLLKRAINEEFEKGNRARARWLKNRRIELVQKLKKHLNGNSI